MKNIFYFLIILTLCAACGSKSVEEASVSCPIYYFVESFPKRPINLSNTFGNDFGIVSNGDTSFYTLTYNKKNKRNLIKNASTDDTIFYGEASRYKGVFFLSHYVRDSVWHIQMLKKSRNLIIGFGDRIDQMCSLQDLLYDTARPSTPDDLSNIELSGYELTPQKKPTHAIYLSLIDTDVDTLIKITSRSKTAVSYDTEDLLEEEKEQVQTETVIYPNPFTNTLIVKSFNAPYTLEFIDLNGSLVKTGTTDDQHSLDVSALPPGSYITRITDNKFNSTIKRLIKE